MASTNEGAQQESSSDFLKKPTIPSKSKNKSPASKPAEITPETTKSGLGNLIEQAGSFVKKALGERGEKHSKSLWSYLMLLLIFLGYLLGYRSGLVSQIVGVVGVIILIPMMEYVKTPLEDFAKNQLSLDQLSVGVSCFISFAILSIFCFIQIMLHKILSFVLKITMLSPLNKLIGGFLGMMLASLMLGALIVMLPEWGIKVSDEVLLCKELRFLAETVWGKEVIVSWLQ